MTRDSDHPACRNCCRAAGDASQPCRRAASLALAPEAAPSAEQRVAADAGPRPAAAEPVAAVLR